ncbi:MAG: DUF6370 family protein [Pirellulaceae bacterium]
MFHLKQWSLVLLMSSMLVQTLSAEVTSVGENGFQVRIVRELEQEAKSAFSIMVEDLNQWWSSDHTWSGDAANLSFDLERRQMIETLPAGGFVRHMEIVYYSPEQTMLRLDGALGPLQGMGLTGALTLAVKHVDEKTQVELTYCVSGHSPDGFKELAPVVDMVLSQQLDGLAKLVSEDKADEKSLIDVTVELSCGECQFGMQGNDCDLAVRINGETYFVDGSGIDDHGDAHANDGLCNCVRKAVVTGVIQDGRFQAKSIKVLDD